MKSKTTADWDRFLQIVQKYDPYQRLRGIHNCRGIRIFDSRISARGVLGVEDIRQHQEAGKP